MSNVSINHPEDLYLKYSCLLGDWIIAENDISEVNEDPIMLDCWYEMITNPEKLHSYVYDTLAIFIVFNNGSTPKSKLLSNDRELYSFCSYTRKISGFYKYYYYYIDRLGLIGDDEHGVGIDDEDIYGNWYNYKGMKLIEYIEKYIIEKFNRNNTKSARKL